jgi:hypothetical protein
LDNSVEVSRGEFPRYSTVNFVISTCKIDWYPPRQLRDRVRCNISAVKDAWLHNGVTNSTGVHRSKHVIAAKDEPEITCKPDVATKRSGPDTGVTDAESARTRAHPRHVHVWDNLPNVLDYHFDILIREQFTLRINDWQLSGDRRRMWRDSSARPRSQ